MRQGSAAAAASVMEWYRAVVGEGDQEVPFFVSLPPPGGAGSCSIANADERLPVECSWNDGSTIVLDFTMFATRIVATRDANGGLSGTWRMSIISGVEAPIRFAATRVPGPDPRLRFPAAAAPASPPADFTGTWKFQFTELEAGKGIFTQTPDGVVTGTITPVNIGDMRYMAGNAHGNTLELSTFDGQHAYVLHATLDADQKSLAGVWFFTHVLRDPFKATRVPSLDIALVEKLRLRRGKTTVTVPQLDASYHGKPVIIDYFGSWCPGCMDETPFLLELYRRHHPAGLEILSIALEGTPDDAYNQRQVELFRKKYAIPWQIVVLPGEYAESEHLLPPELEGTGGFPVTIFLDRDQHVTAVHSGFFGPATGDDSVRLKQAFEGYVEQILASPGAGSARR